MPKPPSDSLHKLIHSLNPIEKRTVTNALKSKDGKQDLHFDLYQAINKMKVYEAAAEIKLRKKDSTFAARKNYLFKTILKHIDQSTETNQRHSLIERHVRYSQILAEKSLLKEAIAQLDKAEKLAVSSESFGHLTIIYDIKKRTYQTLLPFVEYQKKSKKIFDQRAALSVSLHHYELIKIAHSNYKLVLTEHGSVNLPEKEKKKLKEIRESELFDDNNCPKTNHARILYHDIRGIHAVYFHQDYDAGYKEYLKVYDYIKKIPNFLEENVYDYCFYASKVVYYGLHLDKYDEVEHVHNDIRKLYKSNSYENYPFVNSHVSQYFIHLEIITIFKYGKYKRVEELDPLITKDLIRFEGLWQEEAIIVTDSNIGMTWLANGNPKKAATWFLKLVSANYTVRQHILNSTGIHLLLALIDLDDIDLFDRYYRSFLRKKQFLPVEVWLLKQLNTIQQKAQDKVEFKQKLIETHATLKQKIKQDAKLNNFNMLLVVFWLKARMDEETLSATLNQYSESEILEV